MFSIYTCYLLDLVRENVVDMIDKTKTELVAMLFVFSHRPSINFLFVHLRLSQCTRKIRVQICFSHWSSYPKHLYIHEWNHIYRGNSTETSIYIWSRSAKLQS